MSSLIGKPLQGGKYKLEKVLGRGGFGLTFRAHQTYLDQVVVIKTLHESFWHAPNLSELQSQFQDEARRLAMCSHPNVVRVSDFFIEDGLPYMVMDYIPGRSLADIVLPENPLPVKAAVDYIQQIGKALQAIHSKGLLHRDVKPQNIMIHQLTGEAVLIDFGIARELTQNPAQTHTSIVSEGYAPIEQYLPKAHRSAATDVYGLAATLYTLLTAQVPVASVLRDRTPMPSIQQLRPDVKPEMAQVIAQGMAIELKDRPQSVGRWLSLLIDHSGRTGKTGFFGRTQKQEWADQTPAGISEMPTQVAAPAYRSVPAATTNKTVAMPVPTGYSDRPPVRNRTDSRVTARPQKQGIGCGTLLGILVTGIFAGAGFWLYEQLTQDPVTSPGQVIPIPEDPVTEPAPPEAPDEIEPPPADEDEPEPVEEPPKEVLPPEPEKPPKATEPPLLLEDSGNPDNAQPGDTGDIVPVPGFPPGASEEDVRGRLGEPTRESYANGFDTSVYSLVPNRVALAYAYDPGSSQVRQSEAAFSPATDRLVMRATLLGMLDGRSSKRIETGLEQVRKGERERFEFKKQGFEGSIERNNNGYVHIHVQN
ncbi:MAG: serine/threonine-protein kinase [Phormidesmis sp.]